MLVIRSEQMKVLGDYMLDAFVARMIKHLQTEFPDQTSHRNELEFREFVRAGVNKAASFDVHLSDNIESFLEFITVFGADFQSNSELSWATVILEDGTIDETEKLNRISEHRIFSGRSGGQ
jgi:hypothetical protein